jgi:CubicO group peptidase (beta-lactamase class C family)
MNSFEKRLVRKLSDEVPDLAQITPGLMIDVFCKGRRKGQLALGKTYDFYDLASLTKIIFTASCSMQHFAQFPRELKQPISEILPWWRGQTTPFQLLTHTAGLDWWQPYYKKLKGPMRHQQRWAALEKLLANAKSKRPESNGKAVYSDLDLWMLGAYLQARRQMPLLQLWQSVHDGMGLKNIFFNIDNKTKIAKSRFAPTEDCKWRKRVLQGEVHDENTWALGGVAPHAGLFGDLESVSDYALKLRSSFLGLPRAVLPRASVRAFTRRRLPRVQGDWGLCFMKPSKGKASCGRHFHATSFGHTGFTGTSIWFDPKQDLLVVVLSNRVHPTRDNQAFVQLRPRLHDWICELL